MPAYTVFNIELGNQSLMIEHGWWNSFGLVEFGQPTITTKSCSCLIHTKVLKIYFTWSDGWEIFGLLLVGGTRLLVVVFLGQMTRKRNQTYWRFILTVSSAQIWWKLGGSKALILQGIELATGSVDLGRSLVQGAQKNIKSCIKKYYIGQVRYSNPLWVAEIGILPKSCSFWRVPNPNPMLFENVNFGFPSLGPIGWHMKENYLEPKWGPIFWRSWGPKIKLVPLK